MIAVWSSIKSNELSCLEGGGQGGRGKQMEADLCHHFVRKLVGPLPSVKSINAP